MKLTFLDRLVIPAVLPQKGDFAEMIARKELLDKINPTQKDLEEYKVTTNKDGRIQWDGEVEAKDFELTEREIEFIKKGFKEKDDTKELTPDMVEAYQTFMT